MGIVLDIEPYCENCKRFEAKVNSTECIALDAVEPVLINHRITCANADFCKDLHNNMKKYLEGRRDKT